MPPGRKNVSGCGTSLLPTLPSPTSSVSCSPTTVPVAQPSIEEDLLDELPLESLGSFEGIESFATWDTLHEGPGHADVRFEPEVECSNPVDFLFSDDWHGKLACTELLCGCALMAVFHRHQLHAESTAMDAAPTDVE